MVTLDNFDIIQDDENYVVKGMGYFQNIDFINGGKIDTIEKAETIRQKLVDNINNAEQIKTTTEERLALLEQAMNDMLLGGI